MSHNNRFWKKVHIPLNPDNCWEWVGALFSSGYGHFVRSRASDGPRDLRAHRVSYCLHHKKDLRDIAETLILHSCDNPRCVNPAHLREGSHIDNMVDREARSRRKSVVGDTHGSSKVSEVDVRQIRVLARLGVSSARLSEIFRISSRQIRNIVARKYWSHVK